MVHYFEKTAGTSFKLDLNTGMITLKLKGEGDLAPAGDPLRKASPSPLAGCCPGLLSPSSGTPAAVPNEDGTVTMRYKLPYAARFVNNVDDYIAAYDEANPDTPMEYDYIALKENIPWMGDPVLPGYAGLHRILLFSMMRGGGAGGNIMNVGRAKGQG